MNQNACCRLAILSSSIAVLLCTAKVQAAANETSNVFRAGAYAMDVSPTKFPTIVNGMFLKRTSDKINDRLHARCLVLDDGTTRLAIVVVDSCMVPRDILDEAKRIAAEKTAIDTDKMLISATHTHSASAAMGALGCPVDPDYVKDLPTRIAEGIHQANQRLAPARVGWGTVDDHEDTHCRRWILRPDKMRDDPFGRRTARAYMHPGYQNPDFVGPAGPVDPELSLLSIQSLDGRPLALLANYSMHYFGSPMVSADYFGLFCKKIAQLINAGDAFVGIMSQGTSGDQHWMDYAQPKKDISLDAYSTQVARAAYTAYTKIQYQKWVPLAMAQAKLSLHRRVPDEKRLAWAKEIIDKTNGVAPRNLPEVYAHEQVDLHEDPVRELKLQAIRIGELGITAIPDEVYAITGLKIKTQSPLPTTFNIELANGSEGYIPPPAQHRLGGYTTWPARTAGLEEQAEPKITETVLTLLEKVSGRPRPKAIPASGAYVKAVLKSKPVRYWRFDEFSGPQAIDISGHRQHGRYEPGTVFYLPGPTFSHDRINRSVHFAGGRMSAAVDGLGKTYTVEMWFWNGLPNNVRPVTGYLFSRVTDGANDASGDHLGIGGTDHAAGRLFWASGNSADEALSGKTEIQMKRWGHLAFVRNGNNVAVYLNGKPQIHGQAEMAGGSTVSRIVIGGRADNAANFEGRLDEVAVYNRALSTEEIAEHYTVAAGQ